MLIRIEDRLISDPLTAACPDALRKSRRPLFIVIALLAIASIAGCSAGLRGSAGALRDGDPDLAATMAREGVLRNHRDWTSWRDLGIALYQLGRPAEALRPLDRALRIRHADRASLFFRARALDRLGQIDPALAMYEAYDTGPEEKTAVRSRIDQIRSIRGAPAQQQEAAPEDSVAFAMAARNTVAVPDFANPANPDSLRAIAKGLAEMTLADLSLVPLLHLVHREEATRACAVPGAAGGVRSEGRPDSSEGAQAIGEGGASPLPANPAALMRLGRRLGAGWIIQGLILSSGSNRIQIDADIGSTLTGKSLRSISPIEVNDSDILVAQKRLVLAILDAIGIPRSVELERKLSSNDTFDLGAFLAFCRGIDLEDRGLDDDAFLQYQAAIDLDPGFTLAARMTETFSTGKEGFEMLERSEIDALSPNMPNLAERAAATADQLGIQSSIGESAAIDTRTSASLRGRSRIVIIGDLPTGGNER
jgi:tetratricopeptide (TPR) repeat protein